MNKPLDMMDVIRAGAEKTCTPCLLLPNDRTEAEARAEIAAKRTTSEVIADCVKQLGPPLQMQPVPEIGTNTYAPEPCRNPRPRVGAAYYNPTCFCGWMMGEHKTATVVPFPGPCVDERVGAAGGML